MRMRLIKNSLLMSIVPLITLILIGIFKEYESSYRIFIALSGAVLQIPIVILCKRDAWSMFCPSLGALHRIGVKRIACAYEPGRYSTDFKVAGMFLWIGSIAPFLASIAIDSPDTYTLLFFDAVKYESPDIELMILSLICIVLGFVILPVWAMFGQAMTIANEGSDGKRYLYRGFAEVADERNIFESYRDTMRSFKRAA